LVFHHPENPEFFPNGLRQPFPPPAPGRRREGLPEAIRKELGLYGFEKHQGEE